MKVLSISTDRKIFEEGSGVHKRSFAYSEKTQAYFVVVFSLKGHGLVPKKFGNLYLYPTNSSSKWSYVRDAYLVSKKIIMENEITSESSIITTQDPFETGFVGYRIKKNYNLPLQLQIHTDVFSSYFKNSILNRVRVVIARFLIPRADSIRVVSTVIKDSVIQRFPALRATCDVLPIFVDVHKIIAEIPARNIKKDFPDFSFIILMASRLSQEKRIDMAITALKPIFEKFPRAGLVICGAGSQHKHLKSHAEKEGISSQIRFAGWQDELVSYYKTADLFLLTSEYEGYGMTLIEAGAAGCPIVTTRVGIAQTSMFVDGYNASICESKNAECISKAVMDIIEDNSKRELYSRRMLETIQKNSISWESYVDNYIHLLKKTIQDV